MSILIFIFVEANRKFHELNTQKENHLKNKTSRHHAFKVILNFTSQYLDFESELVSNRNGKCMPLYNFRFPARSAPHWLASIE